MILLLLSVFLVVLKYTVAPQMPLWVALLPGALLMAAILLMLAVMLLAALAA